MADSIDKQTFDEKLAKAFDELKKIHEVHTTLLQKSENAHDDLKASYNVLMLERINNKIQLANNSPENAQIIAENENLKIQLAEKIAVIAERNREIATKDQEIVDLNRSYDEVSRISIGSTSRVSHNENRIENLRIELASYLIKLSDTKKKHREVESELLRYRELYTRTSKMFQKANEDYIEMNRDFEERCKLLEMHNRTLMETLKLHGIYDFNDETIIHELQPIVEDQIEEEEEDDFDVRPPLKNYPYWRPPSNLTTIMEEDEPEEDSFSFSDSAIDSAQSLVVEEVIIPEIPIISNPIEREEVLIQIESETTSGSSISTVDPLPDKKKSKKSKRQRQKEKKNKAAKECESVKVGVKSKPKRRYSKLSSTSGFF